MPTTFLDRERAFEAKFAHDEEFRFLALARRDKLFGRWAATTLKSSKEEGDALVKTVLAIADGPGHDLALLEYIAGLLSARGRGFEGSLPEVLGRCMQDARAQLVVKPPEYSDLR
jgi:hypothetical protein